MFNINSLASSIGGRNFPSQISYIWTHNIATTFNKKAVKSAMKLVALMIVKTTLLGIWLLTSCLAKLLDFTAILLKCLIVDWFPESFSENHPESPHLTSTKQLEPTELEDLEKSSRIFIAPGLGRSVNPLHFLGYVPGGMGGGINYDAFPDFSRPIEFDKKPECLIISGSDLDKKLWTHYNNYALDCNLPATPAIEIHEASTPIEPFGSEVSAVDSSPALPVQSAASSQCSSDLALTQLCWAAVGNLATAFQAVKVSELKEVASELKIKKYCKMPKLELFLTLMEYQSLDAKFK